MSYFDLTVKTITVMRIAVIMTASKTPQMIAVKNDNSITRGFTLRDYIAIMNKL